MAFSTLLSAWMSRIALAEPAPPTMKNSSRPASLIAASTPMPWSSSWFQIASIFLCAWSRLLATWVPDSTVNSASCLAVDLEAVGLQRVVEALAAVLGQRQRGDALDLQRSPGWRPLVLELSCRCSGRPPRPCRSCRRRSRCGSDSLSGKTRSRLTTGMPASMALQGDLVELLAVVGQDHQRVDLAAISDSTAEICCVDVVGRLDRLELDIGVLLGRGLGVLGDGGDPAVVGGRARRSR